MKSSQAWIYAGVAAMIVVVLSAMCAIGYFAFFRPSQSTPDTSAAYTQAAQTIIAQVTQDAVSTLIAQFTQAATITSTPPLIPTFPTATSSIPVFPTSPPVVATPTWPPVQPPTATAITIPCERVSFIKDVTIPDGTVLAANTPFRKTWRVRNDGSCTWDTSYQLVFVGGTALTNQSAVSIPGVVQPGQQVDVSVDMVSPAQPGNFQSNWKFRSPRGVTFGTGSGGANPIWARITVQEPIKPNPNYAFDFAANFCNAQWRTAAGLIGCNTPSNDSRGSVTLLGNPGMENRIENEPGLWVRPNQASGGFIQGQYAPYLVKAGDHFVTEISCARDFTGCNVIFRVDYQLANGTTGTLGQWGEIYDNSTKVVDIDLSAFAGQNVQFILRMTNNGNVAQANGIWFVPSIRNKPPTPTATLVPTATATWTPVVPTVPINTIIPTIAPPIITPPSP